MAAASAGTAEKQPGRPGRSDLFRSRGQEAGHDRDEPDGEPNEVNGDGRAEHRTHVLLPIQKAPIHLRSNAASAVAFVRDLTHLAHCP
jgi:hypothetical protein